MTDHKDVRILSPDQPESANDGTSALGIYRPGFRYK